MSDYFGGPGPSGPDTHGSRGEKWFGKRTVEVSGPAKPSSAQKPVARVSHSEPRDAASDYEERHKSKRSGSKVCVLTFPADPQPYSLEPANPASQELASLSPQAEGAAGPSGQAPGDADATREDHRSPPSGHQRNQSASGVPTWEGEVRYFKTSRFNRGLVHLGPNVDANSTQVPTPRNWGQSGRGLSQEGDSWSDPANRCKTWVERVSPTSPPEAVHDTQTQSPVTTRPPATGEDEDLPSRPDSGNKALPPTTVYYSDDSNSLPRIEPGSSPQSVASGNSGPDADALPASRLPFAQPNAHSTPSVPDPPISVASSLRRGRGSNSQLGARGWRCHPDKWWRQEVHPMQNPLFAPRRICVTTPFPFLADALKNLMYQHFIKYGRIRLVQPLISDTDTSRTVFVVFQDEHAVYQVLDDPTSIHCTYQSTSRTPTISFDIQIDQVPSTEFTRFLWIKFTGPRPDASSQSPNSEIVYDNRTLPEEVTVWGVPHLLRHNRLVYRVYVAGPGHDLSAELARAEAEAGVKSNVVTKINFGNDNPEEEIISELVNCFVDIVNYHKPSEQTEHGWVFECAAGPRELQELLHTVTEMPGITIRFAKPNEYARRPPSRAPARTESQAAPLKEQPQDATAREQRPATVESPPATPAEPPEDSVPSLTRQQQSNRCPGLRPPPSPVTAIPSANPATPTLEQAPWFNQAMPTMMPIMVPMMPVSAAHGEDAQVTMMPVSRWSEWELTVKVMWPMGFPLYPGMTPFSMAYQAQNAATAGDAGTTPTPASVPGAVVPPSNSTCRAGPSAAPKSPDTQATRSSRAPSSNTKATCGTTIPPTPPSEPTAASPSGSTRLSSAGAFITPRVTHTQYQGGLFTPTYDADDLKVWQEAQGIQGAVSAPLPAATEGGHLPLLPGFIIPPVIDGHDPKSTSPTPPAAAGRPTKAPQGDVSGSAPISSRHGPSHGRRGSSSAQECQSGGSRVPKPEQRKWDDGPRNRGPKVRNKPRGETPAVAPPPPPQMDGQLNDEATGW